MSRYSSRPRKLVLAAILGIAIAGPALLVVIGCGPGVSVSNKDTGKGDLAAFRDEAEKAGIKFRMTFLEEEQGAKFKINLYDHGCGVAVGDYDGDGYDDIYFCNQLGKNVLYRNNKDGTFTDVTDEA